MNLRRIVSVAALLTVLAAMPGAVLATHGEYHGYCKDGVPVVTEWPEKYKDYDPECLGDMLIAVLKPREVPITDPGVRERPADSAGWAVIFFNNFRMINPYNDVLPYVTESTGRTLVPIRMVTEAMGGTAEWEELTRTVTIQLGDKNMTMTIGKPEAVANGRNVELDQPPLIWKDRTMVPLRVIAEAFGAFVHFDVATYRVDIKLAGVECHPRYCVR